MNKDRRPNHSVRFSTFCRLGSSVVVTLAKVVFSFQFQFQFQFQFLVSNGQYRSTRDAQIWRSENCLADVTQALEPLDNIRIVFSRKLHFAWLHRLGCGR